MPQQGKENNVSRTRRRRVEDLCRQEDDGQEDDGQENGCKEVDDKEVGRVISQHANDAICGLLGMDTSKRAGLRSMCGPFSF